MPRSQTSEITFTIDGREVRAPENTMLVDAAKLGDVEIPVFCYEPKLGAPVGACRMCLVEIEGIPKLQTACSTGVRDGMVVFTETERVKQAQNAVVEFLLLNHPLDCPVCDKGGECPLQDISFGWGNGVSRMVEPKRHLEKPVSLSPLIAIDRERCIHCYRCVRFSQELSEDYQLVFRERGYHTYVATFDGSPYVAPFSGNIIELCPVGALTSQAYRFRARPWDIESAASVCTLCPAQCNTSLTVRDDRVMRVRARDNSEIDDGWLCDRGRFAYQAAYAGERITTPLVRGEDGLEPASWERALDAAGTLLRGAGAKTALLAGGGTVNEVATLAQRIAREALRTPHLDCRAYDRTDRATALALADPALQATVPDLEFAHSVLMLGVEPIDEAPILDLRLRKGVRRNRVALHVVSARPSALDPNARTTLRHRPGDEPLAASLLAAALAGEQAGEQYAALAAALRDGGEDVVVLYGERVLADPAGGAALIAIAEALSIFGRDGAGLLGVPSAANGRGLREAGLLPFAGPGYSEVEPGRDSEQIVAGLAGGELDALWLLEIDPCEELPGGDRWRSAIAAGAGIVAHTAFMTDELREHADVILPAELDGERDGTVTHPAGIVQRVWQGVGRPGDVRPGWWVMSELARRVGLKLTLHGPPRAPEPFTVPIGPALGDHLEPAPGPEPGGDKLSLGTFRTAWLGAVAAHAPALAFLRGHLPRVELSPADAERLGVRDGARVALRADSGEHGSDADAGLGAVEAAVSVRSGVPQGAAFLEGHLLSGPLVDVRPLGSAGPRPRSEAGSLRDPAAAGEPA